MPKTPRFSAEISALQAPQSRRGSHRREGSLPRHLWVSSKESKEAYSTADRLRHGDAPPRCPTCLRTDISVTDLVARYWEWAARLLRQEWPTVRGINRKCGRRCAVLREYCTVQPSAASFGPLARYAGSSTAIASAAGMPRGCTSTIRLRRYPVACSSGQPRTNSCRLRSTGTPLAPRPRPENAAAHRPARRRP